MTVLRVRGRQKCGSGSGLHRRMAEEHGLNEKKTSRFLTVNYLATVRRQIASDFNVCPWRMPVDKTTISTFASNAESAPSQQTVFSRRKKNAARVFDIDVKRRAVCRTGHAGKDFFAMFRYMDSEENTHIADLLSWHNQTLIGTHNFT